MRADSSLQALLDPGRIEEAFNLVCGSSDDFMEMCRLLGLDPSCDFRFADLREVDFSRADLRGFDFRGADLRGSFGIDITVDESTNLAQADLEGSCFASYYRETRIFQDDPMAGRMYRTLLEGDPFEISAWLHQRFRNQRERHSILKRADPETAAILCQKLLADDIDLTKRTDLLFFLRSITNSPTQLRELMRGILARHSQNETLVEKFATIASSLHGSDPEVRDFIFQLCTAKSPRVRLAAFKACSKIGIFMGNFGTMHAMFMDDQNIGIRKGLILESATRLGRSHISCINRLALPGDLPAADVLDMEEFFDGATCARIADILRRRHDEIEERLNPEAHGSKKRPAHGTVGTVASASFVFERQADVLANSPVLEEIFERLDPDRFRAAEARLLARRYRDLTSGQEAWRRGPRR